MYENLEKVLEEFKLNNYDIVYVASAGFALYWDNMFDKKLIKVLKNIMKGKTIIMPTFSFDFCDKGVYSVNDSTTFCGLICERFRKEKDVVRTCFSPMHNVSIWGKLKDYFNEKEYISSFGENSIFRDMDNFKCGVLLVDCSFDDGVPFVHCLENKYKSNYRSEKVFKGKIIQSNGVPIDYVYKRESRNRKVNLSARHLGDMFYQTGLVKHIKYEKSNFDFFKLNDFYSFFEPIFLENPEVMEVNNGN